MIRWRYIGNLLREHRVLLLFVGVLVGLFQVMIISLAVGSDLLGVMEQLLRQLPPQVQLLFGEQFMAQFSVTGAVSFGYNHPLMLVLLSLVAILLPSRHVAGEIENGTLEILFTMPVRRSSITGSLWLCSGLVVLGGVAGAWAGTGWGMYLYPEVRAVPFERMLLIGVNLWLLLFAISSYTLLIAAYAREGGKATLRATSLTVTFYFINLAVVMWPTIDFLRPFTIFHYHQPQEVMKDGALSLVNVLVLSLVILVAGFLAVWEVNRRDIPG